MPTVKCIITYPDSLISDISEFEINGRDAVEEIENPGKLKVQAKRINTQVYISVVGILFGQKNAKCNMDVFVDDEKVNEDPVKPTYKRKMGGHLFNWWLL